MCIQQIYPTAHSQLDLEAHRIEMKKLLLAGDVAAVAVHTDIYIYTEPHTRCGCTHNKIVRV